jgi:ATP-dependent DNA helicase RecG
LLAAVGIMRNEGEGVPRIFEEMEESLLKQPGFAVEAAQFCVTLRNEPIFAGPPTEWQAVVSQLPLTTSQKRVLLAHPGGFSNEDYRTLNNVDRDQAYKELQEMVAAGVVLPPAAAGRGAVYRLSPSLVQTRTWMERRIPMLQTFFRTHERLTNSEYRALFNVTRHAAGRDLRRLAADSFLVMEGTRKGTYYRPGPLLKVE